MGESRAPPVGRDKSGSLQCRVSHTNLRDAFYLSSASVLYFTMDSYHKSVSQYSFKTLHDECRGNLLMVAHGERGEAVGPWDRNRYSFVLAAQANLAPTASIKSTELVAQAKPGDKGAVALWTLLTQVGKQTSALPNQHHKATA